MILHHFDASPFSEKIRSILGYKQLAWSSVQVPRILPKPDLMPLTGGYRRTPVLQIGRDIYADTRLIARVLDAHAPTPPLILQADAASVAALEMLGDQTLFMAAIPILLSPPGLAVLEDKLGVDGLAAFRGDRLALFENGRRGAPDAQFSAGAWHPALRNLEAQLAGRAFLLGDTPTLADFAIYHPVWYIRGNAGVAATLSACPRLLAWAERMQAIGHGQRNEITADAALEAARQAEGFADDDCTVDRASDLGAGQAVAVAATDYGSDAVQGKLVHLDDTCIIIERQAGEIGWLRNHFPRSGFVVDPVDDRGHVQAARDSVY